MYLKPISDSLFACLSRSSAAVSKVCCNAFSFLFCHLFEPRESKDLSSGPKYFETKFMCSMGT